MSSRDSCDPLGNILFTIYGKLGTSQVKEENTDGRGLSDRILVLNSSEVTTCLNAFNQLAVMSNVGHRVV